MQVILESMRVLVVEARGRKIFYGMAALCAVHALCFLLPAVVRGGLTGNAVVIGVSLVVYAALLIAGWGPMAEKLTVTFDGAKHRVVVEELYPLDKKKTVQISFDDFTQFEVSPPLDYGCCRLRMKTGKAFLLFRLGAKDDYSSLRHLDTITRKHLEVVHKRPDGAGQE